jgi:hypothetical protein
VKPRVTVLSEYELRRYIEADEIRMRALGHTRESLRDAVAAGTACWSHDVPVWESLRTNHWLLTGEVL